MFLRRIWVSVIKMLKFLPQAYYVKYYYEYYNGKRLNYENPVEFNQKISWYKVFYKNPLLTKLADKYAVREYVKEKIGEEYLNECIGVYNSPNEINWDELPNKFVVKAVHSCNFNLIVPNKSKVNIKKANLRMRKWLMKNQYYRGGLEWAYKNIKPRLIIERFMSDERTNDLIDYKFYCFNGEPKFLAAQSDKKGKHFYDLNWNENAFGWRKKYEGYINKPEHLEKMKEAAIKLADKLPFVRVDLYYVNSKVIFGEMTFYPTDARDPFYPEKYNTIAGDYFTLPTKII